MEKWKDNTLRKRINEGDEFRYIGIYQQRKLLERTRFALTRSELLRLQDRGIPYEIVSDFEKDIF